MDTSSYPDLMTVLANIGNSIPPIIMMMQGFAVTAGVVFTGLALMEYYCIANDNATKFLSGASRYTVQSATTQLVIGAILLLLGTLELVGIMTRSVTGDFVASRVMSYQATGTTMAERAQAATYGLLGLMQLVGFVAMFKGWLMVNRRAHGQEPGGAGLAWTFVLGGLAAWNFQWVAQVINNTTGFNLIGMFNMGR